MNWYLKWYYFLHTWALNCNDVRHVTLKYFNERSKVISIYSASQFCCSISESSCIGIDTTNRDLLHLYEHCASFISFYSLLILGCSFKGGWLPQSLGSHFWSLSSASSTWSCMVPSYKSKTWVKWMQLDCQLSSQFFSSYEYFTLLIKICKLFNFGINKSNSLILSLLPFHDCLNAD